MVIDLRNAFGSAAAVNCFVNEPFLDNPGRMALLAVQTDEGRNGGTPEA
ncbi:MAG: hypothetical protein ACLUI3_03225 [Christensenellales bacterium]